jgi:hypothetical protein
VTTSIAIKKAKLCCQFWQVESLVRQINLRKRICATGWNSLVRLPHSIFDLVVVSIDVFDSLVASLGFEQLDRRLVVAVQENRLAIWSVVAELSH